MWVACNAKCSRSPNNPNWVGIEPERSGFKEKLLRDVKKETSGGIVPFRLFPQSHKWWHSCSLSCANSALVDGNVVSHGLVTVSSMATKSSKEFTDASLCQSWEWEWLFRNGT